VHLTDTKCWSQKNTIPHHIHYIMGGLSGMEPETSILSTEAITRHTLEQVQIQLVHILTTNFPNIF